MRYTVKETLEMFKKEHPDIKIGNTVFKSLRPTQVKLQSQWKFNMCICQKCGNATLKLTALRSAGILGFSTIDTLVDGTMCSYEKFPQPKCVDRECDLCVIENINEHDLLDYSNLICYEEWEKNEQNRVTLTTKETTGGDLLYKLCSEAENLATHLINAKWQGNQLRKMIQSLPEKTLLSVLDFAENYTCIPQNEVQSAHWYHEQATLHPTVLWYKKDGNILRHTVAAISDDKTHDSHAVDHFYRLAVKVVEEITDIDFQHHIQWTDGCATQYKCRTAFYYLICTDNMMRNFFESGHGKGPSDGESGVIKNRATTAVKAGKVVVRNA